VRLVFFWKGPIGLHVVWFNDRTCLKWGNTWIAFGWICSKNPSIQRTTRFVRETWRLSGTVVRTLDDTLFFWIHLSILKKSPETLVTLQRHLIGSSKNRQVSLEVVRESITLLQNRDNVLPIPSDQGPKTILVTGPNSNTLKHMAGGWYWLCFEQFCVSLNN
jgi:hypothetical protein